MKIGIDISKLHQGSLKRGIGFYTKYLIEALKKYSGEKIVVIENNNKSEDREGLDIIHYPFFDLFRPTLPVLKKVSTVITIHDVIPLVFPDYYPAGIKGKLNHFRQRLSLYNVEAIITDSECSKKDIERKLKVRSDRIFPVYLAPAGHFRKITDIRNLEKVKKKYNLPEKFAIYAGSVNWNKNLNNLAKACTEIGVELVLAGKDFDNRVNLDHRELKSFKEFLDNYSTNSKIHILGFVDDEDLVSLFNLAEVLLLVSRYEGFGLTILEAQACGLPVITSNVSSMVEVADKSALMVNPEDVKNIAENIRMVMSDSDLKSKLIKKGFENVKRFSWKKTADETLDVYKRVLKNKK